MLLQLCIVNKGTWLLVLPDFETVRQFQARHVECLEKPK